MIAIENVLLVIGVLIILVELLLIFLIREMDDSLEERFDEQRELFINGEINVSVDDSLKKYEEQRDAEFDKKIEEMRQELYGTSADVLMKGIENIPHDEVDKELLRKTIQEEYAL